MLNDGDALPAKLYHVVYRTDLETRQSVKDNGLVAGRSRHQWHPQWAPRPGHVYLATPKMLSRVRKWDRGNPVDVYAVNTAHLMKRNINPDEDWFVPDSETAADFGLEDVEGNKLDKHPLEVFHLTPPPNMWIYDWAKRMGTTVPSFGEWAELVNLSSAPQTRFSLSKGTIAYRGEVPPVALKLVHSTLAQAA